VSTSSRLTNSRSDRASSRCGGKPSDSDRVGSAQSVHSRATLKLPRSNSRRNSVSTPATRHFLSTSKRWPRSGWKGWRISAHPKSELGSSAVRVDRPIDPGPGGPGSVKADPGTDLRSGLSTGSVWIPAEEVSAHCHSARIEGNSGGQELRNRSRFAILLGSCVILPPYS